jgi:hypothetical protein
LKTAVRGSRFDLREDKGRTVMGVVIENGEHALMEMLLERDPAFGNLMMSRE